MWNADLGFEIATSSTGVGYLGVTCYNKEKIQIYKNQPTDIEIDKT
jgi:hypothetical protein